VETVSVKPRGVAVHLKAAGIRLEIGPYRRKWKRILVNTRVGAPLWILATHFDDLDEFFRWVESGSPLSAIGPFRREQSPYILEPLPEIVEREIKSPKSKGTNTAEQVLNVARTLKSEDEIRELARIIYDSDDTFEAQETEGDSEAIPDEGGPSQETRIQEAISHEARMFKKQCEAPALVVDPQGLLDAIFSVTRDHEINAFLAARLSGAKLSEIPEEINWTKEQVDATRIRWNRMVQDRYEELRSKISEAVTLHLDFATPGVAKDRHTNPTFLYAASSTVLRDRWPWAPDNAPHKAHPPGVHRSLPARLWTFSHKSTEWYGPAGVALRPGRMVGDLLSDHTALRGCGPTFFDGSEHSGRVVKDVSWPVEQPSADECIWRMDAERAYQARYIGACEHRGDQHEPPFPKPWDEWSGGRKARWRESKQPCLSKPAAGDQFPLSYGDRLQLRVDAVRKRMLSVRADHDEDRAVIAAKIVRLMPIL
jgi:hypothetical protein